MSEIVYHNPRHKSSQLCCSLTFDRAEMAAEYAMTLGPKVVLSSSSTSRASFHCWPCVRTEDEDVRMRGI